MSAGTNEHLLIIRQYPGLASLINDIKNPAKGRAPLQFEGIKPGEKRIQTYPPHVLRLLQLAAATKQAADRDPPQTMAARLHIESDIHFYLAWAEKEMLWYVGDEVLNRWCSPRFHDNGLVGVPVAKS
ncbi:MAG: hypothetical protein WDN10_03720 [bacterium]